MFAGGRWSLVEQDFHGRVNASVGTLKVDAPALPPATLADDWNDDHNHVEEGKYIDRLAASQPHTMAKVHQCGTRIYVAGNEVELCDIYTVNKDFIHLKIWRGSQGFSALAMQAGNAA